MFTYIVLNEFFSTDIMLVTNDLNNAIEKVKNSKANCIQIWSFDKLLDDLHFTKRFYWNNESEFKDYFDKQINTLIKYVTDISGLNIRFKFYENDGTVIETKDYNRVMCQISKTDFKTLQVFIDDDTVCFSEGCEFEFISETFIKQLQIKLYEKDV